MTGVLTGIGILVIGASQFAHNGYLITSLHDALQADGATVVTYGACATIPESWLVPRAVNCGTAVRVGAGAVVGDSSSTARSWSVVELIHQYHPQIVVVGIADTLAAYRQPELPRAWIKREVHELVDKITAEHVGCVWLGTTWGTEGGPLGKNFARVKELSDELAGDVAPCDYVDSLAFSTPGEWPTTDGQHHTAAAYLLWGAAAKEAIEQTAAVKALGGKPGG